MGVDRWGFSDVAADEQVMPLTVSNAPVQVGNVPVARPIVPPWAPGPAGGVGLPAVRGPDRLAVASAVCGMTAIVPVVSQVMGLALGVASLVRIRRARRCGLNLGGRGWALAGIVSSGFVLLSWIAVLGLLCAAGSALAQTADALGGIAPAGG